jgi:hypothetical protein
MGDVMEINDSELAEYIADMTNELSQMACLRRFERLAYLLDIAKTEAQNLAKESVETTIDVPCH